MKKRFFYNDISKLFNSISIAKNGEIICNNIKSVIYKITPITVLEVTEQYKENIYNAYYSAIRGMPSNIQIISLKDSLDFSLAIAKAQNRYKEVQSDTLKFAINKYVEKLQEISLDKSQYVLRFYILFPSNIEQYQIEKIYESLISKGIKIIKISDVEEIKKIMKQCIKKEEYNERYYTV